MAGLKCCQDWVEMLLRAPSITGSSNRVSMGNEEESEEEDSEDEVPVPPRGSNARIGGRGRGKMGDAFCLCCTLQLPGSWLKQDRRLGSDTGLSQSDKKTGEIRKK